MKGAKTQKELLPKQREELLETLEARFEKNVSRHPRIEWAKVKAKLEARPEKLWSLSEMERTGGEPDVVAHDPKTGEFIFFDCSPESPRGRTSLCYDRVLHRLDRNAEAREAFARAASLTDDPALRAYLLEHAAR